SRPTCSTGRLKSTSTLSSARACGSRSWQILATTVSCRSQSRSCLTASASRGSCSWRSPSRSSRPTANRRGAESGCSGASVDGLLTGEDGLSLLREGARPLLGVGRHEALHADPRLDRERLVLGHALGLPDRSQNRLNRERSVLRDLVRHFKRPGQR